MVTVLFFAAAKDVAGMEQLRLEVSQSLSLVQLQQRVLQLVPALRPLQSLLLWAVNNQYAVPAQVIESGDTVACFPPVSGG